jgi:hypothetical protein
MTPEFTQPTRNPELVLAIRKLGEAPSPRAEAILLAYLKTATYLAATVVDGSGANHGDEVPFQSGPLVQLVSAERQGKTYLPLFTDFQALRAYTQREVAGMVVPAADAWSLVLARFDGAVINPANDALPLELEVIRSLVRDE